ncbi:hypothetical protein PPERSA_08339 [Pseudocohnilembus persalinus]|uniref:RanBP2-type domain-containing protein n=1 Tax=Pseudocohnilembus persalinus TaxID=266149 RepID=A0A0V0QPK9_PSEPJ|nr:hypothetical protein PPERSA_08339 [Pseudocohnilembus persalinus]|eukprot:KRX04124.1 hypothetical protein PPERSA_08339 [Pseudocohnilembus persalinus]
MGQKQFNDILVVNNEQPYFLFDGVYCIKCFLNSQIQEEKKGAGNGLAAGDVIRIENYSFSVDLDEKQQVDLVLNLNKFVCTGKSKKDNFNLQQFKMVNQIEDIYLQTTRKKLILKQQQQRNNLDNYLGSLHIFLNFEKFQQEKEKYMDQVKQEKMQTYIVCKGGLKTSKMQDNLKAVQFYILGENENIDKKVKQEKNDNALKYFLENQNQISQTKQGINSTYNFNNNNLCNIRKSKYGMVKLEEDQIQQQLIGIPKILQNGQYYIQNQNLSQKFEFDFNVKNQNNKNNREQQKFFDIRNLDLSLPSSLQINQSAFKLKLGKEIQNLENLSLNSEQAIQKDQNNFNQQKNNINQNQNKFISFNQRNKVVRKNPKIFQQILQESQKENEYIKTLIEKNQFLEIKQEKESQNGDENQNQQGMMIQEKQLLDIYDPNRKNQGYPKSNKEVRKQRNQAVIVEKQKKKKQRDPRPAFVIRSDSESGEESNEIIFLKDEQKSEFKSENQVQLQKSFGFSNIKIKEDSLQIGKNDKEICQNWFCKFCNSINVFSKQGCSVCKLPQNEFMQRSQISQYQLKQQEQSQAPISVSLNMGNMLQNIDQNQRQFTKKRKKSQQKIILIDDDDDQEIQNIDIKLHNGIDNGQKIEEKKQNFIDLNDEKKKSDYNDDKEIYFLSEPQKKQKTENKFHYQLKLVQQEQMQHNQQKQLLSQMKKDNQKQIIQVDSDSDTDTQLVYQKKNDNFINFQNILHQSNGNLGRENMEIEILNQKSLVDNQQQQEFKKQLNNNYIDIQS